MEKVSGTTRAEETTRALLAAAVRYLARIVNLYEKLRYRLDINYSQTSRCSDAAAYRPIEVRLQLSQYLKF